MKLAFISDIHGNAEALDAVLKDMEKRNIDQTFVLGDLCFRGPEPKQSLDLVRSLNTDVIKGNADDWVVRGMKRGEVPDQALELMAQEREWTYSKLKTEEINYLESLQEELNLEYGDLKIHAFHATPNSLFEIVQPFESDEMLKEKLMVKNADIFIYAHIHKPYIRYLNGKCIVNTGSVGLPFDGQRKASYMILEIGEKGYNTSIVRVGYDTDKVIAEFQQSDYPNRDFMINVLENSSI